jgi:hypothetical protein
MMEDMKITSLPKKKKKLYCYHTRPFLQMPSFLQMQRRNDKLLPLAQITLLRLVDTGHTSLVHRSLTPQTTKVTKCRLIAA